MSMSRYCYIFKASNQLWYMKLATDETDNYINTYGGFSSLEKTEEFLSRNFANPGGFTIDESATAKPPLPEDVIHPTTRGY